MSDIKNNPYDVTVSDSEEASIAKAIVILHEELEQERQRRIATLIRPEVSFTMGLWIVLGAITVFFVCVLGCTEIAAIFGMYRWSLLLSLAVASLLVICLKSRTILIWCIMVYQQHAPTELRLSCCFKPSCSEYMKLAIEKYGVLHGFCKGIKRLLRCHYPNGGVDNP